MIETFLAIGGAIVLAGNVGAVIVKVIRPFTDMKKKVEDLERHEKKDFKEIQELHELNTMQCKMLLVMIDHMIDGNHVETMKKTREQIIDLLANDHEKSGV